ncbi:MAG: pilus assembly protein PilY [Proteobacteria bacterium]|nr:pilus assembly protein PilY [Pseudomonadota bacterium]
MVLWLFACGPAHADDTDLFKQNGNAGVPNIIFILDNTANWTEAAQHWPDEPTAGQAELQAIKHFIAGLTKPANVGLIMYTTTGQIGGYVRFGVRGMTNSATDMTASQANLALQNITQTIYTGLNTGNKLGENVPNSKGGIANTLYETWLYLTSSNSWAGMDPSADYSGNPSSRTTSTSTPALTGGFAYQGSAVGSRYIGPSGACGNTYIIFIGNNNKAANPALPASTDPSLSTLKTYSYSTAPDVQSAWTRFLRLRPDLGTGTVAANNGAVFTYTIDAYNAQQSTAYTQILKNMAAEGGGEYAQAGSYAALNLQIKNFTDKMLATNSVYASASLPVSVSVRGSYLNQVYLGVFRPDGNAQPNWVGNLKQYKLGVNNNTSPPSVILVDSVGASAENATTGFVNPGAVSFWTAPSTFWNPTYFVNSQGLGGSSDSPDGDLVEKGGVAQYLRTTYPTSQASRRIYTCTGTGSAACGAMASFDTNNSGITNTLLGAANAAEHDAIINWVRGGNVNLDDPANLDPSNPNTTTSSIRGFVHGDVLHSRPAIVNYNRTSDDIMVFYGSNDGMLHAVKGGQDTSAKDGSELWSFIAPEHYGQFKRMRDHTPLIDSSSAATAKPYFMDGSPTVYTSSTSTDGKIDYTRGDKAYLFMSMRRGGRFIYAFDVSNPANPTVMWKRSNLDTGFSELGQSWSDPRVAKIRYSATASASGSLVLIFGLGYDAAAEDPDPINQGTATKGRGVMVVDMLTGNPIWQAGPSPTGATYNTTVAGMTRDIPAAMAIYDSNRDGFADRIYAGDTGANIWRINIDDASPNNWTVGKLAALGGTGANARKFLYPPDIVPASPTISTDSLLIGSGDREHPFDTTVQNRFYMIKDKHDLLYTPTTAIVEGQAGLNEGVAGKLYDATADLVQTGTSASIAAAKTALDAASGWYAVLQASGEKVVGGSTTIAGTVFFGTNSPTPPSTNMCGSLGIARLYGMSFVDGSATIDRNRDGVFNTADLFEIRAGGGLPPTPTPFSVVIDGKTYQGAITGPHVIPAPGPALGRRYRTYWQRMLDSN